ncbi:glycosyltransferase family 25 protein [Alphaproteobacteria bacterium]|nr:glycosyltransferase family 25 protein [Alphaproteobacteria bacterium]
MTSLPQVIVLHLTRMKTRRKNLAKALDAAGFSDVVWIDAVDGTGLDAKPPWQLADDLPPVHPFAGWADPYARRAMTLGEVGCMLSHVLAWQHIAKLGKPAIVLQDDALPVESLIDSFPYLLHDLSFLDFHLVYLAQRNSPPPRMLAGRHVHIVDYHPLWTLAYLLAPDAAQYLCDLPWHKHVLPSDEFLPAAFGLNNNDHLNALFFKQPGLVVASHQRLFTPQGGSETSQTEKSQPVADTSASPQVFTVASDDTADLQRLLKTGERYGADIKVLGLGQPWKGGDMNKGPGGGQKLLYLRAALKNIKDNAQPLLFCDGYDVVFTRHVADIMQEWRTHFDEKPVFAAEVTCSPDADRADDYPQPDPENPYRFLNSGLFIGKAGDLKKLLRPAIRAADDDQRYFTKQFLEPQSPILLDRECRIFQCLNQALDDLQVDSGRGMLYNRRHDSWPAVIHANGPSKDWLEAEGAAVGGRWRKYYGAMDDPATG